MSESASTLCFDLGGVPATLHADHALSLRVDGGTALVVADLHFGKAATFRARGLPVPQGTTTATLHRLGALLASTGATRLIVLGDFLHAREAHAPATLAALRAWRDRQRALEILLVEGNHDRHAGAPPAELDIRVVGEPWRVGPLALCHHPQVLPGAIVLAGHLHPCVRLYGGACDSVRLPCFWWRPQEGGGLLLLPAFGEFTGGAPITRETGDRVIALGDGRLFELPPVRRAAA